MKGEIFNLLEDFIVENWGVETFEKIYTEIHEKLATKEPFVGPGTYPDSDFIKMAGKAVEILGVSLSEAVNAFGKFCFPRLAAKMPNLITPDKHPKEILLILDSIIHVEVKKVYKDSEPPKFSYKDITDNSLTLVYESKRKFYDFVDGMLNAMPEYFGVPMSHERNIISDESGICEYKIIFYK